LVLLNTLALEPVTERLKPGLWGRFRAISKHLGRIMIWFFGIHPECMAGKTKGQIKGEGPGKSDLGI